MKVAIIGCGLIGVKRAAALSKCQLVACCDTVLERAQALARSKPGAEATTDWHSTATHRGVDLVLVATSHDRLAEIACVAAAAGKHVLIEKPGARRAPELDPVLAASRKTGALVRIGFNHRFHRALQKAWEIFETGALGELMFIRGRYGHGGRPGYADEWRARPEVSGGGEMIDQGMHMIDLARWFLGDFTRVRGRIATYFWPMQVEDNGFMLLETALGQTAFLHASWTEWKNLFSFEIAGRLGKLEISGLGGSYGVERLTFYQMLPEMGPPVTTAWEYPMADNSWEAEVACFLEDIQLGRQPRPGIEDAQAALHIVAQIYEEQLHKENLH
jgi:predicted dehydrogenase